MGSDIAEEKYNRCEDIAVGYVNAINSRVYCILVRNKFCLPLIKYFKGLNSSRRRAKWTEIMHRHKASVHVG